MTHSEPSRLWATLLQKVSSSDYWLESDKNKVLLWWIESASHWGNICFGVYIFVFILALSMQLFMFVFPGVYMKC